MNVIKTLGKISEITNQTREMLGHSSKSKSGYLKGRRVHWTTYIVAAGAAVGAITVLACFIFGSYNLLPLGGGLLVTNAMALWRQKDYDLLAPLNVYIKELEELIGDMDEYVTGLKDFKSDFKRQRTRFQNTVKTYKKTADQQAKDLKVERKEYDKLLKLSEKNNETFEIQLKKAYQHCLNVQNNTKQINENVDKIVKVSGTLTTNNLSDTVNQLETENKDLLQNVQDYKDTNNELAQEIEELRKLINQTPKIQRTDTRKNLRELHKTMSGMSGFTSKLSQNVEDFDSNLTANIKHLDKSKKATKELGKVVGEMSVQNEAFTLLITELKKHDVKWDEAIKALLKEIQKEGGKQKLKNAADRVFKKVK